MVLHAPQMMLAGCATRTAEGGDSCTRATGRRAPQPSHAVVEVFSRVQTPQAHSWLGWSGWFHCVSLRLWFT